MACLALLHASCLVASKSDHYKDPLVHRLCSEAILKDSTVGSSSGVAHMSAQNQTPYNEAVQLAAAASRGVRVFRF